MARISIQGEVTTSTSTGEDVRVTVAGATNLIDLNDVSTSNGLVNGQILNYNSGSNEWQVTDEIDGPLTVTGVVDIQNTLTVTSGSQNRTIFASGNDGGEIQLFAFDSTGNDIFTGMHFRTGSGRKIMRLEAKSPGGTDPGDNSHDANVVISGQSNSLLSKTPTEGFAPFTFQAEEIAFGTENTASALKVFEERVEFDVPIGQVNLSADPANPDNGWTYYNTTTNKLRLYAAGAWVDLN